MSTHDHMTGRSSSDPALRHQDALPVNGGSSLKILVAIGAVVAILVIALWFGGTSGTNTITTPEAPAAMAPADPASAPESLAPADPAAPPVTDPGRPAPSDTGSAPAPVTNQ